MNFMLNIEIFFIIMWMLRKSNWITTLVLLHKPYFMLQKYFRQGISNAFAPLVLLSLPSLKLPPTRFRYANRFETLYRDHCPPGRQQFYELWSSFIKFYVAGRIIIFSISRLLSTELRKSRIFLIRGNVCRINLEKENRAKMNLNNWDLNRDEIWRLYGQVYS